MILRLCCLAAICMLGFFTFDAHAQRSPCSVNNGWCDDEGAAYAAARGQAVASYSDFYKNSYITEGRSCPHGTGANYCKVTFVTGSTPGSSNGPGPFSRYWQLADSCAKRPDMTNARYASVDSNTCSGGCQFVPVLGGGETYGTSVVGGQKVTRASRLAPTGATCSSGDAKAAPTTGDEDQCVQDAVLTQCIKKDGTICTGKNKQFCFKPGESGIKTSGNEAASNVPDGKATKAPPVPPANGGDWEKIGDALVKISETKGGTTTTSNSTINNYSSSYGSSGSGASGNGANGQSNGGSGDGSGKGDGKGDGDGDGDGAGSTAPMSELYKKSDKNVESVLSDFYSKVQAAPIMGGISSFMTVPGGGSCPVFSLSASRYWQAMSYDGHCSGSFLAFLHAAGYVILAIAAYFALRIAVT